MEIYVIQTVQEPREDKNGNSYVRVITEEYVDNDGVIHNGHSLLFYNENIWKHLKEGAKVQGRPL